MNCFDLLNLEGFIEFSMLNCFIELGFDFKVFSVGFEVVDELLLCGVFWEGFWEGYFGKLVKLFWEVEFEVVVGFFLL